LTLGRRPVSTDNDSSFTNLSRLEQKTIDFENIATTFPDEGANLPQVVFCTLGTTRANAGSAEAFKKIDQQYVLDSALHFLYCSSGGSNANSYFLYMKTKGETEKALAEIGFERVSIFQPAFLKVVEPRNQGNRYAEWVLDRFVPVIELFAEKSTTISVASVAQAMRLVGTSESVDVQGVSPKSVGVNPKSKTKVAYFNNHNIHDIVNQYNASSKL
ncbi:Protein fmp52, mitochondrial, partial [Linnemannia gamsii]